MIASTSHSMFRLVYMKVLTFSFSWKYANFTCGCHYRLTFSFLPWRVPLWDCFILWIIYTFIFWFLLISWRILCFLNWFFEYFGQLSKIVCLFLNFVERTRKIIWQFGHDRVEIFYLSRRLTRICGYCLRGR
jgi:hypothetical protein